MPKQATGDRVEPERHSLVHARSRRRGRLTIFRRLGPGLITGAADDDPSGIGTYSQLGARFGLTMLWTVPISLPLAAAVEELAGKIRVDAQGLRQTVQRHNRFAERGDDEEFGKGATEFDRNNGDPRQSPNPCLGRIETQPFYAMAVYPSTLGSSVGLRTDADGRALTESGEPIAGLFVCGSVQRSSSPPSRGSRWGL